MFTVSRKLILFFPKTLSFVALTLFSRVLRLFGYVFSFSIVKRAKPQFAQLNLNIGAGRTRIEGFKSLDVFHPHYHPNLEKFKRNYVPFDLRRDSLPYADSTVENIYASHVLEHVELRHVKTFFFDSYRVLKKGGVLRIAVPDARFLFSVSSFVNDFWAWNSPWSLKAPPPTEMTQIDFLVQEIATSRFRFVESPVSPISPESMLGVSYTEFLTEVNSNDPPSSANPSWHVTALDYQRLAEIAKAAGFSVCVESKPHGSVSKEMQGADFDLTHPQMTLYADFVKQ